MQRPWNLSPSWRFEPQPCLTFAPLAWLKLHYFCHFEHTEIGGFGIAAAADLLYVGDFVTVRQQVTPLTVRFANGWHQYGWCPELDLVTYEPVEEDLEHARTHKSRVA